MNPPYIIGSFQYFRLYIWPPPGITRRLQCPLGIGPPCGPVALCRGVDQRFCRQLAPDCHSRVVGKGGVSRRQCLLDALGYGVCRGLGLAYTYGYRVAVYGNGVGGAAGFGPRSLPWLLASAVATGATACATTGCACAAIIMQMAAMRIADIMIVRLNFRPGYLFSDCRERS